MYKFIIAFFLLCGSALGQESSICKVYNTVTGMQGSAVMVYNAKQNDGYYLGLAATAAHVVSIADNNNYLTPIWDSKFNITHSDGSTVPGVSTAEIDVQNDIALIWVTCPNSIPVVRLHDNLRLGKINLGYEQDGRITAIFQGYGMGRFMTHKGFFSFRHKNDLISDSLVTPGQSGGAMWINGELAGIISRGYDDYDAPNGAVWPATCVNSEMIPPMVNRALTHIPK